VVSAPASCQCRLATPHGILAEIARAKKRFGLPQDAVVHSCYESGRDGFWLHRFWHHEGINNVIVDSSSIEVNRRARRAKSEGLDAVSLIGLLVRYREGTSSPVMACRAFRIARFFQIRRADRAFWLRRLLKAS
jgi:transposase